MLFKDVFINKNISLFEKYFIYVLSHVYLKTTIKHKTNPRRDKEFYSQN